MDYISLSITVIAFSTLLMGCKEKAPQPGEKIWLANCKVCHETGLAGAPVIGNQAAWVKRINRGTDSLYEHAISGWGDMPARGGNTELSDSEVKQAVDYMISKSK
jgi:cytochrome c5